MGECPGEPSSNGSHLIRCGGMAVPHTDTSAILQEDESLDALVILKEAPQIKKPFSRPSEETVWRTPRPFQELGDRSKEFVFDRPKPTESAKLLEAVGSHQAEYMKKIVLEKEKEINMLQKQLIRCNNENVKLIRELEGFKGKNYPALAKENILLRDNYNRILKENIILRGNERKLENTVLQKLSLKQELDSTHLRRVQSAKPLLH